MPKITNGAPRGAFMPLPIGAPSNNDPLGSFLQSVGAARLDPSGRPMGSTGGAIALSPDDEERLAAIQRLAPINSEDVPSPTPNPLARLGKKLGLTFAMPHSNVAVRSSIEAMSPMQRLAGSLADVFRARKAYDVADRIEETGGLPSLDQDPTTFAERMNASRDIINNSFLAPARLPKNAYVGDGSTVSGREVLAAGGAPVSGYGGTIITGETVPGGEINANGVRTPGTHNRFTLTQNPATVPAASSASSFMPRPVSQSAADVRSAPTATMQNDGTIDLTSGLEALRQGATVQDLKAVGFNTPVPAPSSFMPAPVGTRPETGSLMPRPMEQAPFDRLVSDYDNEVAAALRPTSVEPEVVTVDGVRLLKTANGYRTLPAEKDQAEFKNGHTYDVRGRKSVFQNGRFIDVDTGAPLYVRNALGEQVDNPLVFGSSTTNEAGTSEDRTAVASQKPVKGQRVRQNGYTFEFDGNEWVPVGRSETKTK